MADSRSETVQDKLTLMIPGPTPVPETVLKALGRHPIGHRSGEFQAVVKRTTEQLRWLHQTTGDVLVITGSGTAARKPVLVTLMWRAATPIVISPFSSGRPSMCHTSWGRSP